MNQTVSDDGNDVKEYTILKLIFPIDLSADTAYNNLSLDSI